MTYKVPESKRSIAQNRFEFETPDGATHSIPKAKYLTTGQIETLSTKGQQLTITDLLDLFDNDDAAGEAVRQLDSEQLQALMEAWQEDSGLTVGESRASS
jgi:hypothetical protein